MQKPEDPGVWKEALVGEGPGAAQGARGGRENAGGRGKAEYVYIRLIDFHVNQRALDRQPHEPKGWYGLSEEALVALEDAILSEHPEVPEWLNAVA
jgi:hypothetical protein